MRRTTSLKRLDARQRAVVSADAPERTRGTVRSSSATEWLDSEPVWKVGILDLRFPRRWEEHAPLPSLWRMLSSLRRFEGTTWREILQEDHNHRWEPDEIDQWSREARARLEACKVDQENLVYQLAVGKGCLFGIRQQAVFSILWWDRDHEVYKTKRSRKSNRTHRQKARKRREAVQASELAVKR